MLGVCAAFAREQMDNTFRTGARIEQLTGIECLGIIPKIAPQQNEKSCLGPDRTLPSALGVYRYATEAPFSRFAETLRSVKVAADISKIANEVQVLGIISALPHEGKTLTAANFAALLAHMGCKTLLIDGDLRHTSLTQSLIGDVNRGLIATIQDPAALRQVIWRDPVSGFDFLPAETDLHMSHTSEIISSARMAKILEGARSSYDYVILDLPPIAPVVDVKAISHLIERFIMVVEWGKTTKEAVLEALNKIGSGRERILGIVLNKADPTVLKRHEMYLGSYYNLYYNDKNAASGSKHTDLPQTIHSTGSEPGRLIRPRARRRSGDRA
jgi:succinoglycan biosynthesis transport protein ExoP